MIFSLPNGMQAYMIVDGTGRRLDAAPTEVVTDKNAADKAVRNGLACMRCHERGMQRDFKDIIRPTVQGLPSSTTFDKEKALGLYRDWSETEGLLKTDEDNFMKKMERLLGKPQESESLKPVSARFLDTKLNMKMAGAELGLTDESGLPAVFRLPQFLEIGLAPLASGQEVAREAWEQYFDEAARRVGAGLPVVPLDAASRPNHEPLSKPFVLVAATNKKGDTFQTGEDVEVFVKASKDVFIEVVHTTADGKKTILVPSMTKITAKEAFRLTPKAKPIKLSSKPGTETITILACEVPFVGGEVMNGFGVPNRVIHRSGVREENGRLVVTNGPPPTRTIKKTLTIEVK